MNRKWTIGALIFFAVTGLFLLNGQGGVSAEQKAKIDALTSDMLKAPDFTLKDLDDQPIVLSDYLGKVVVLNFWATWCGPCRIEIPEFNELHHQYKDQGFEILGVSISDTKSTLMDFTKAFQVKYPVLYGSAREVQMVGMQYGGINAVPTSFIINRKGELVRMYPGALIKGQPMYQSFVQELETELAKK